MEVAGPLHADTPQPTPVASGDHVVFESAVGASYALELTAVDATESNHHAKGYEVTLG